MARARGLSACRSLKLRHPSRDFRSAGVCLASAICAGHRLAVMTACPGVSGSSRETMLVVHERWWPHARRLSPGSRPLMGLCFRQRVRRRAECVDVRGGFGFIRSANCPPFWREMGDISHSASDSFRLCRRMMRHLRCS